MPGFFIAKKYEFNFTAIKILIQLTGNNQDYRKVNIKSRPFGRLYIQQNLLPIKILGNLLPGKFYLYIFIFAFR